MPDSLPKKTILIIDDEKSITLLLSAMLKNTYELVIAHDSHEAIVQIHKNSPDLITLDINMPGLGGDELLPVIRAWRPSVPVLVVSAISEKGIQEKCIEKGVIDFLLKPFEMKDLLNKIESFMNTQVQPINLSNDIVGEVELAIAALENKGLITKDQTKEEIDKVKYQLNN